MKSDSGSAPVPEAPTPLLNTIAYRDLVFNLDLYPRIEVDFGRVEHLADVLTAGHELPPITVDAATNRVVDGFHRARAYFRVHGAEAEIPCELGTYESEADLLLDAIRLNASHGRPFDLEDRRHATALAEKAGIAVEAIADVLNVTVAAASKLTVRTIQATRQSTATRRVETGDNPREVASTNEGLFHINVVLRGLRSGAIDPRKKDIRHSLGELVRAISERLRTAA